MSAMADFVIRRWDLEPYPGDQAPVHVHHSSDEAFCVLEGVLEVLVGQERRVLRAGDFVVVPAGARHTFATVGDVPASVLAVMTPQIADLVDGLHQAESDQARQALWARYESAVVGGEGLRS
jgi:mannose-6-phosphate isomerase-like protein (cupin superfamily)